MSKKNIILHHLDHEMDRSIPCYRFRRIHPQLLCEWNDGMSLRPFEAAYTTLNNLQECINSNGLKALYKIQPDDSLIELDVKLSGTDLYAPENAEVKKQLIDELYNDGFVANLNGHKVPFYIEQKSLYSVEYWDKKHKGENK